MKYQLNIDTLESGIECLERIKEKTYDLILMDDMMPKMSGVETFEKLILEFEELDDNSMSFRYPFTKNGSGTKLHEFLASHRKKAKGLFGEFEYNEYQNVDFGNVNIVFEKIHNYVYYLNNQDYILKEAYGRVVELFNGNFFKDIFHTKYLLSQYEAKMAQEQVDKALILSKYLKEDFIPILDKFKKILDEINNKFELSNTNYEDTKELFFYPDKRFKSNILGGGEELNVLRQSLKEEAKKLKKLYNKYVKDFN